MRLLVLVLALGLAGSSAADGVQASGMVVYGAEPRPCLGESISPELHVAELHRLAELSATPAGVEVELAQTRLSLACLDGLASPASLAILGAVDEEVNGATATLRVMAPLGLLVWLDGEPMSNDEVAVAAGLHLLQVGPSPVAPVRSLLLEIGADARVLVTVPAALVGTRRTAGAEVVPEIVTFRGSRTAPVFLAVGASLAVIGGLVTAVGARQLGEFNEGVRDGTLSPFPGASAVNPEDAVLYRVWQSHTRDVTVGCALMGIGAGIMVLSIPIELAHRRAQVGLTAEIPLAPDGPRGFALGVVVR